MRPWWRPIPTTPLAAQALYMAGFSALGQADYQTALKHARAFLAAYPGNDLTADVMHVAAESSIQLGQFGEADKLLEQLLKDYPNHADVEAWKVRRGLTLFLQKKYPQTIAALQPLLAELHSADAIAEAHYLIGSSQAEQGHLPEAVQSLEASLAAQPNWRQADDTLLALANVQQRMNKLEPATRHAGQADCRFSRQSTAGPGRTTGWVSVRPWRAI